MRECRKRTSGFTLIELLIVIAVIGLLIALVLPAVQSAREASRRSECKSHLKQIGLALHSYHATHRVFPPGWVAPQGWAWTTFLLPYIDQPSLYKRLNVDTGSPPDAGTGLDISLPVYVCPSDTGGAVNPYYSHDGSVGYKKSNYPGLHAFNNQISGSFDTRGRGVFGLSSSVSITDIKDGTTHTFMVGEREMTSPRFTGAIWIRSINGNGSLLYGPSVVGTCGSRVRINAFRSRIIGFSSLHTGGAQFLLAGGSVRFVSENISSTTYRNLAGRDDDQIIKDF